MRGYANVYFTIQSDDRTSAVWRDDALLGLWLRLLVLAEQAWPEPAYLPRSIHAKRLHFLVDAGCIELVDEDRYRFHGLDTERTRRAEHAKSAANARWNAPRNASGNAVGNAPSSPPGNPDDLLARAADARAPFRPRSDSVPSPGEDPTAHARAREEDAAVAYFEVTTRVPSGRSLAWLNELATAHGEPALCAAIRATDPEPVKTFLSRVQLALTDVTVGEKPAPGPRTEEEFQRMQSAKRMGEAATVIAQIREAIA